MFKVKRTCRHCKKAVKDEWLFCPFCGINLNRAIENLNSIENLFNELSKILAMSLSSLPQNISITFDTFTKNLDNESTKTVVKEKKQKLILPKIIEEPKTEIKYCEDKCLIFIEIPNVKRLKDVDIHLIGQSLEIRAVAKDKGYFKIIPLPKKYKIISKILENSILKLELVKQL